MRNKEWEVVTTNKLIGFAIGAALFFLLLVTSESGFVFLIDHANLLFHAALSSSERDHPPYPERNNHMASHYKSSLRQFILANHYMDSFTFHLISGRDIIHKFGYQQCSKK